MYALKNRSAAVVTPSLVRFRTHQEKIGLPAIVKALINAKLPAKGITIDALRNAHFSGTLETTKTPVRTENEAISA